MVTTARPRRALEDRDPARAPPSDADEPRLEAAVAPRDEDVLLLAGVDERLRGTTTATSAPSSSVTSPNMPGRSLRPGFLSSRRAWSVRLPEASAG